MSDYKIFKPRLKEPSATNRYWIHTSKGGLNQCILVSGNSTLPNCVGFSWGRWYELLGSAPKLSKNNAERWYDWADGYTRGKTPKLGAIACWKQGIVDAAGKDGAGHVAVVEQINQDGTIITSNSSYGGRRFFTETLKPPYVRAGFQFQGFIYPQETFVLKVPSRKPGNKAYLHKDKAISWIHPDNTVQTKMAPDAYGRLYTVLERRWHDLYNDWAYRLDNGKWAIAWDMTSSAKEAGAVTAAKEIKVGSMVKMTGYARTQASGGNTGRVDHTGKSGVIDIVKEGTAYPYHVKGIGWFAKGKVS